VVRLELVKRKPFFVDRECVGTVPAISHGHFVWAVTRLVDIFNTIIFVEIQFSELVDVFGIIESCSDC
jgi:hypothetical protein